MQGRSIPQAVLKFDGVIDGIMQLPISVLIKSSTSMGCAVPIKISSNQACRGGGSNRYSPFLRILDHLEGMSPLSKKSNIVLPLIVRLYCKGSKLRRDNFFSICHESTYFLSN